ATRRETDLVEKVATKVRERAIDAEARAIARRLLTRDDAESLVAGLLRESLGSPVVAAEEAARARRAKNPPPFVAPAAESPPTTRAEPHARSLRERASHTAQDSLGRAVTEIPTRNAPLPQTPPPALMEDASEARRPDAAATRGSGGHSTEDASEARRP